MSAEAAIDDYVGLLLAPQPAPPTPPAAAPAPPATARPVPPAAATAAVDAPEAPAGDTAAPRRRAAERSARWLRLRCGGQVYALELLKIREVVRPAPLLPLRGADPAVAGLINLRGQVVPVVDLGLHLGEAAVADTPATRVIVLEAGGDVLGLRVDSIDDVAEIGDDRIEPAHTARLAPVGDPRVRGIARVGGEVILLLDAARLLEAPLH